MNKIRPFKFWCQKVLPLVYDDSLSYYELLCKLVDYLNNLINNQNELGEAFNELQNCFNELKHYVDDYFNNLNVQEEINKKLDEMVQDGSLAWIIDNQIFKGVMNDVRFLTPNAEQKQNYVDDTLKIIATYFANNTFSDCIKSGSVTNFGNRIIYKYAQGKGYMGILGSGDFIYNDTEIISDVTYNIVYIDCSTFLSLILKSIGYPNSPYPYAFTHDNPSIDELTKLAIENQDMNKPYTIDWFNNISTSVSSFIMNQSGCCLQYVAKNNSNNVSIDKSVLNQLETGDILYMGHEKNQNKGKYLGIYHCGYYLKTLDELNRYMEQYNMILKASDTGDGKLGYVVHCVASTNGLGYGDVLEIWSLEKMINFIPSGSSWSTLLTCKPRSNSWNDNKSLKRTLLMERRADYTVYNTMTGSDTKGMEYINDVGQLNVNSIGVRGIYFKKNDDLNNFLKNGVWSVPSETIRQSLKNIPPTTLTFDMIGIGFGNNGIGGTQIALCNSTIEPKAFLRTTLSEGTISPWCEININSQSGYYYYGSVGAHSVSSIDITFSTPFAIKPNVLATLNMTHDNSAGGRVSVATRNITTTGFNLIVYNDSDNSANIGASWFAN